MVHICGAPFLIVILTSVIVTESLPHRKLPKHSQPHHRVKRKRDLRVDLVVPSMGLSLVQRIQRKLQETDAADTETHQSSDSDAREEEDDQERDSSRPQRIWKHRGYFGQDMSTKSRSATLPTPHSHNSPVRDRHTRTWKNLMEPRTPEQNIVGTARVPVKRRDLEEHLEKEAADIAREPALKVPSSGVLPPKPKCCTELGNNATLEQLMNLVPSLSKVFQKANGSLLKEIISASLSRSLQVERIYGGGDCACDCPIKPKSSTSSSSPTWTAAVPEITTVARSAFRTATKFETGTRSVTVTKADTKSSTSDIIVKSTDAKAAKGISQRTTATMSRSRRPEWLVTSPTTYLSSPTGKPSPDCPRRVYIKLSGERLPPTAQYCRRLWLPENVYRSETFWECEDTASEDCKPRGAPLFLGLTGGTSRGSAGDANETRVVSLSAVLTMVPTVSTETETRRLTSRDTFSTAERTSKLKMTSTTWSTSTSTRTSSPSVKITKPISTVNVGTTRATVTMDGWNIHIPFHWSKAPESANTKTTTAATVKLKHHHYDTSSSSSTTTRSPTKTSIINMFRLNTSSPTKRVSLAKSSTRASSTLSKRSTPGSPAPSISSSQPSSPSSSQSSSQSSSTLCVKLSAQQIAQLKKLNGSLVDMLSAMCGPAQVTCSEENQKNCTPKALSKTHSFHHHRTTHHRSHDDEDDFWQHGVHDGAKTSTTLAARVVQYHRKESNVTAFAYPFHEAEKIHSAATTSGAPEKTSHRMSHYREKGTASEGDRETTRTTLSRPADSRTTYFEVIFGLNPDSNAVHRTDDEKASKLRNPLKRRHVDKFYEPRKEQPRDEPSGFKLNLVKSSLSLNALIDAVRNPDKCRGTPCFPGQAGTSRPQSVVVKSVSAGEPEYEYYYVYDDGGKQRQRR